MYNVLVAKSIQLSIDFNLQTAGSSRREIAGGGRHVPTNMVGRIHLQRILSSWGKIIVIADKTKKEKGPSPPQQPKNSRGGGNSRGGIIIHYYS